MLVEVVLESFIGEVDAELFKAVVFIILKTKDVQDSYGQDLVEKTNGSCSFLYLTHLWNRLSEKHCEHQ